MKPLAQWALAFAACGLVVFAVLYQMSEPPARPTRPDPLGTIECPEGFTRWRHSCVAWPEGFEFNEGEP